MKARILGSGSSGGVPRIGGDWGACDPADSRNRRRRCSLLITREDTAVLIDTAPDMREQLLDAGIGHLDAVFYTHAHADQAHGIDDLRMLSLRQRKRIPIHAGPDALETLTNRFEYCFTQVLDYPPILDAHELNEMHEIGQGVATICLSPFDVQHGSIVAQGYCVSTGSGHRPWLAYIPDVSEIPETVKNRLAGIDVLVVDALRYKPHPSHAHVARTLEWIDQIKPKRSILTNLHIDLDYSTLAAELPDDVEPAYDGMEIELATNQAE